MRIKWNKCIALSIHALLMAACATTPDKMEHQAQRNAATVASAGWLYARATVENPVNRPVSHAASLASLALKSTGGLLRRLAIGAAQLHEQQIALPVSGDSPAMNTEEFEAILDRVTGTRREQGRIQFLVDGDEYFPQLANAIGTAQHSIDMRTYIFDNDDFAVEVADQLRAKSADVRVRIMLDGLGNMLAAQADPASLPDDHRAALSIHRYLEAGSKISVRSNTNPWFTGDHTKTTIIDKRIAFVGGMNIGREYRYDWHDLMMRVTGPVVDTLQFESDKTWARTGLFGDLANFLVFARGKTSQTAGEGIQVRVLQTMNFDSDIYKAQIAAIRSARRYIYIENAYFSDDRMVFELGKARRRGVDVRVIMPSRGNHGPMNASNNVTINRLLEHGIRVFAYPGMTHVKAAVYDGWACVGSANFDKLSLKVNKELNLATSDAETVNALLDRVFFPDMDASEEIFGPVDLPVTAKLAEIMVDELL